MTATKSVAAEDAAVPKFAAEIFPVMETLPLVIFRLPLLLPISTLPRLCFKKNWSGVFAALEFPDFNIVPVSLT